MRVVQAYRQGRVAKHRHVVSLGAYDVGKFEEYRKIFSEWKVLPRAKVVVAELSEEGGRMQGREYLRACGARLWRAPWRVARG